MKGKSKADKKVSKVMREFKSGGLHSGKGGRREGASKRRKKSEWFH